MRDVFVGSLLLAMLSLCACDLLQSTPAQRRAEEAALAATWFTPVPALQFDQAATDAWVEAFARHSGNCRTAWLDGETSPRLHHATLRAALEAHARDRPGEANERFGSAQIFVGARDRMQPLLAVQRRRLFDGNAGAPPDIHLYWVNFKLRYGGNPATLQQRFVEHWGGTPTLWQESHEMWSHPRYASGGWTLFVPDAGRHELDAHDPAAPTSAFEDDAARERWLDAATAGSVEMPRMPAGELPLITLTCRYAMHEAVK